MEVKQIYNLVNDITREVVGETGLINEDLSNVVDVGDKLFNSMISFDNFTRQLVDQVGKMVFVNRVYKANVPSVLRDGWEFGAILAKIDSDIPEATENESWELQDGATYEQDKFTKPNVYSKFWSKKTTFEIERSITELQVKSAFQSATQLNSFFSMLQNEIEKSLTVKTSQMIMRVINNMMAETIHSDFPTATYNTGSGIKAVNLLYLYKTQFPDSTITANDCLTNTDFLKFASYTMGVYSDRLTVLSNKFNIGGRNRFTPKDMLHFVVLSDFAKATDSYLNSITYHNEFVKLPKAETVPYWQAPDNYSFDKISAINVKTSEGNTVTTSGILGVMFDHDALGVTNEDRRVTTHYNARAEFTNYFYKVDSNYFNDFNENMVVFFVA